MSKEFRIITTKTDIPEGTTQRQGFYEMDMGKEGTWLVDQEHPGYYRCRQKAIQLAEGRGDKSAIKSYSAYPEGKDKRVFTRGQSRVEDTIEYSQQVNESIKPKPGRKKNVK